MPLDTCGYQRFGISLNLQDVANQLMLELYVDPSTHDGADVLVIYTGTLTFNFPDRTWSADIRNQWNSAKGWRRGTLDAVIPVGTLRWTENARRGGEGSIFFKKGVITAALSSMSNKEHSINAGWAVDAADVSMIVLPGSPIREYLRMQMLIAVSDVDGLLQRIAYQVTALGQTVRF